MNRAAILAAVVAVTVTSIPASAHMMSCTGDMSQMTAKMGAMPDGPQKWKMNRHLAMLNAAMAKDGARGCNMMMRTMMGGSKMGMMKHGM